MNTGKPDLQQPITRQVRVLFHGCARFGLVPGQRKEGAPVIVDAERMARAFDVDQQRLVAELHRREGCVERGGGGVGGRGGGDDGVPDSQEFDRDEVALPDESLVLDLSIGALTDDPVPEPDRGVTQPAARDDPGQIGWKGLLAIGAVGRQRGPIELFLAPETDQALVLVPACQRADRERAAAEAETPDAIVIPVVAAQELVELQRILLYADAEREAKRAKPFRLRGANAVAEGGDLVRAGEVERFVETP